MDRVARHLIISGLVQGVGYRYATLCEARHLGLSGWVRNRRDGTVEAVVAGSGEAVAALIAWARQGPPAARVSDVRVSEWLLDVSDSFEQNPTI
ncbi:MAG TPA: acylphosphatase [Rhodocyclaceae bacterium]|nr:acylphosphatase [Rhodocyclaceae bacterium]